MVVLTTHLEKNYFLLTTSGYGHLGDTKIIVDADVVDILAIVNGFVVEIFVVDSVRNYFVVVDLAVGFVGVGFAVFDLLFLTWAQLTFLEFTLFSLVLSVNLPRGHSFVKRSCNDYRLEGRL